MWKTNGNTRSSFPPGYTGPMTPARGEKPFRVLLKGLHSFEGSGCFRAASHAVKHLVDCCAASLGSAGMQLGLLSSLRAFFLFLYKYKKMNLDVIV